MAHTRNPNSREIKAEKMLKRNKVLKHYSVRRLGKGSREEKLALSLI